MKLPGSGAVGPSVAMVILATEVFKSVERLSKLSQYNTIFKIAEEVKIRPEEWQGTN